MITRKQAVFALNFVAGWADAVGFLALVGSVLAAGWLEPAAKTGDGHVNTIETQG